MIPFPKHRGFPRRPVVVGAVQVMGEKGSAPTSVPRRTPNLMATAGAIFTTPAPTSEPPSRITSERSR